MTDRFSRTGDGATAIITRLSQLGIYVYPASENYDPKEASGEFLQSIMSSVGKLENRKRAKDTVEGMLKRLESGYPCGPLPIGYISDRYTKPKQVIHTRDAPLVKKGFELYAAGHSLQEVSRKVALLGLRKNKKRWNEILQNPLYAGFVRHNLLGDRIIKGKFEPIVSEELFLEVNQLREKGNRLFTKKNDTTGLPLKKFLVCTCGTPFTGYQASKKLKVKPFYYKCNATGCGKNISASKLHDSFFWFLGNYQLPLYLFDPLKAQLKHTFENQNREAINKQKNP